ncbi:MFS transporter [Acetonema longum]|uniref:Major facilitator superfamily permease n=1 Tax=Acetonema longum DSM 6540 TaxID=1009370 RepID=F7NDL7_9FIRM|nr:MFS transporter [Acetonema longum]EGO65879.1 major facilitator superfamily permease [Acetonema longum DSM 6540]
MENSRQYQSGCYIALLTAGHFLSDFYVTFLPGLLPMVIERLGLSLTLSGLLVMIYSFTSNLLQPVFGYYVDKSGYSWMVLLTIPVSAVFICLSAAADSIFTLFLYITLSGLAASLFHPLASALLGKVSTAENKGLGMSFFIGGGNFGVAAAPAVVMFFLFYFSADQLIWLAIPGLLVTWGYYWTGMHRMPLGRVPQIQDTASQNSVPWYRSASLLKLNVVMGLRAWPQSVIPNFMPVWLLQQGHSPALAGSMITVFLFGGAIGSIFGGYLGDRMGRKPCIIASLAICIPALYVFLASREVTLLTWAALWISGACLQATLPSSVVWAQEMLPANAAMASGMMMGLAFGLGGGGRCHYRADCRFYWPAAGIAAVDCATGTGCRHCGDDSRQKNGADV